MPIYLMSLVHMPRVVRLRLEKIQRDFLWGGGLEGNKEGMTFNEEQFRFLHGGWKKSEILGR